MLATERERLPGAVLAAMARLEANTAAHAANQRAKAAALASARNRGGRSSSSAAPWPEPFQLNLAVSYGARGDLARAARRCCDDVARGALLPSEVDEAALAQRLSSNLWGHQVAGGRSAGNGSSSNGSSSSRSSLGSVGDPDVLIRTSGEHRLSNFLLFECAYTELFFLDKCAK